jgi:phospholipase C
MEWVALLVMTLLLQGAFVTKATAQTVTSAAPYDHIVVVILENHGYSELLGASNSLPFINGVLRASGADMTQSYSLQHPSQDNYYWIFSGSNQGIYDDKAPQRRSPTLRISTPN